MLILNKPTYMEPIYQTSDEKQRKKNLIENSLIINDGVHSSKFSFINDAEMSQKKKHLDYSEQNESSEQIFS